MSLQALLIFNVTKEPITLVSIFALPTLWFFQKGRAEEIINFVAKTIISRSGRGHHIVEERGYRCFVSSFQDNLVCVAVASSDYPNRTCFSFLRESHHVFVNSYPLWYTIDRDVNLTSTQLVALLDKYQHPEQVDVITKIEKDLDETKDVMIKNIDALLNRGEKLDDLLNKAENLSKGSKEFLTKTKRLNRCCIIV